MNKTMLMLNKKVVQPQFDFRNSHQLVETVSKLRMPCCNSYIEWNGTGLTEYTKIKTNCSICGTKLVEN